MSDEAALVPTEIRTVEFYGDEITSALVPGIDEPVIYVPLRPLCDFMGLSWSAQRERTMRDEVLQEAVRGVRVTRTPGIGGGTQELLCLPLKFLPGWLFGISAERIKDEAVRAKIIQYRRECYDVLWNAFKHAILPQTSTAIVPVQGGAALAYELATAVQNIAREQMQFEQRMNNAAQWAKNIDARVTALEVRLQPDHQISTSQAGELALQVKTLAAALEQRTQGKRLPARLCGIVPPLQCRQL